MTVVHDFQIQTIPNALIEDIRAGRPDVSGRPAVQVIAGGGEPVRCCLRDAAAGDELLLFGYEPPLPASPYREMGAVYVHARSCPGPRSTTEYPTDWYGRSQVLRAYDSRGWIHPATRTHNGSDPESAIVAVLAEPDVVQIHSRNIAYGCYMFTISRPARSGGPASR
jgi:hypothetical protein